MFIIFTLLIKKNFAIRYIINSNRQEYTIFVSKCEGKYSNLYKQMLKKIHQSWLVNEMENPSVLAGLVRVTENSQIFVCTYMKRKIH
jgi:hypothetical protein